MSVRPEMLVVSDELRRSGSAKQFEDRLTASIREVGLAEPLKVAPISDGKYLVVDGTMRLKSIESIRAKNPDLFQFVPVYLIDYSRRFEIRYQTDIYQDLLPSQLAGLVEHLHKTERIRKSDIARYIGVSPTTLRNYTGLWRLIQRHGLFERVVELMDAGIIPASNPYAWLRLTESGVRHVLTASFSGSDDVGSWISGQIERSRHGAADRFTTGYVESATGNLQPGFYREDEDLRSVKKDLGLRRSGRTPIPGLTEGALRAPRRTASATRRLSKILATSKEPVLRSAAESLQRYLA